ncbi:hypothetical protein RJ639_000957 [Escallonia herrerae]|uniref:Uncharacterized protein n=1 Tax=Escallonia herrerae TaxID=1293975 RepID=A0AA88XR02_9ASTE|nr:hypothetical protein RJ639_000957 [Escallonia herrerae]
MATRLLLLFALCVLPAIASAQFYGNPFLVQGRVYCDTCRAGFETSVTKYLAGARVKIECRDRVTLRLKYSIGGVTDSTGTYAISVTGDRKEDMCDAMLVGSPDPECSVPDRGRDRARVILTRYNGMINDTRFANAMGFLQRKPLGCCTELLKTYLETDS